MHSGSFLNTLLDDLDRGELKEARRHLLRCTLREDSNAGLLEAYAGSAPSRMSSLVEQRFELGKQDTLLVRAARLGRTASVQFFRPQYRNNPAFSTPTLQQSIFVRPWGTPGGGV